MTKYEIIDRKNGTFGVKRAGSSEAHGSFDTWAEACEAVGMAGHADAAAKADPAQY